MSTEVLDTKEVEALSVAVLGIDAARRVGWAKAFDALRRVESLEEQVRQMTDERKYMRRAYSRLLGFIAASPIKKSEVWDKELTSHFAAEKQMRQQDAWDKGRALGHIHKALVEDWSEEKTKRKERQASVKRSAERRSKVDLFSDAQQAGHYANATPATETTIGFAICSCGTTWTDNENESAYKSILDHIADVVHGCSWRDYLRPRVDMHLEALRTVEASATPDELIDSEMILTKVSLILKTGGAT